MVELQFSLQGALSSQAIAWFSSGHFSHVDAVIRSFGKKYLLGARSDQVGGMPSGVQPRNAHYANWTRVVTFEIEATFLQELHFTDFLIDQIGKPYDHQAIFGFMLNRDWRENDSWICSELQAAALEHAGILPKLYLAANKITPVALALAVSAAGGKATSRLPS